MSMRKVLWVFVVLVFALPALAGAAPLESQANGKASNFPVLTPQQGERKATPVQLLRKEIEALHEQIRDLLEQSSPDPIAIGDLMIQIKELREQIEAEAKDKVIQFIQLTPEQVALWDGFVEARKQIVQPLRKEIEALHEQIRELLEQPILGATDIENLGNMRIDIKGLMEQIKAARNAYIEAFKGILTEDQIKKLDIILKREKQKTNPQ
jgi:polyhydroxyalkanoate synthesis regulator phasin